ncbi:hypothetical protein K3495_g2517 [Podosphaera aphanis]|nr:hypothetical protein K3495_g2517 [Podosphaera aphanis]
MHCQESCRAPTKYRNCGGPHRSDSHKYLVRPTRAGPPSKEQLKVYRQAGEREYLAFARARSAEERATAVAELDAPKTATNSPPLESPIISQIPDIEADNTPTPPDEDLSGDQLRLRRAPRKPVNPLFIFLTRACDLKLDVLLIQKLWWSGCTKSHPCFDRHIPFGSAHVRPRAITYTQKNSKQLIAVQKFPLHPTGDYCWMIVNGVMFLNVYKSPKDPLASKPLLEWTPPPKSNAIGDFNAVHRAWQPGASSAHGQGEAIEMWAEDHNLTCLIVDEPTHRAGNTLDLARTNISGTSAWVDREECVTSDHLPICGLIPDCDRVTASPTGPLRASKNNLLQFAKVVAQWIPPIPSLNTIKEVEDFAHYLTKTLTDALRVVGKHSNRKSGRSAPWWTPECKEAHLEYRAAVLESEHIMLGKAFRDVVAKAKNEYWKKRIESMHTPSDVFNLMGWLTPRQEKIPPPLLHNGNFISDHAERATVLRDSLLARHKASEDLPNFTISNEGHIPWTYDLTESEVRTCTIGSGNSCPGADGISVELLATCWDSIGLHVTQLYRACLQLGYHSSCFQLAEIVVLPKPGRDPSPTRGWRPIALLFAWRSVLKELSPSECPIMPSHQM